MPSLKEIKGRIGSVQSTLKITSAMKLVASAKLRKAQQTIEGMRPYERKLQGMLDHLVASGAKVSGEFTRTVPAGAEKEGVPVRPRIALVAFASNSSLCGAFNANAVRLALETIRSYGEADVMVHSIGRKMADAMRKAGHPSPENYQTLADKPSYAPAAELAEKLMEDFREGRLDRIDLVYNHFVSSGKQVPVRETLLPMGDAQIPSPASPVRNDKNAVMSGGAASVIPSEASHVIPSEAKESEVDYILEPSASDLLDDLLPKSLRLKFYTALLDSNASEHAARTVAMQTATDNGEDLLQELTLQYNKSRQQKITSEILDLAGGSQQQ
jgi:F-type H+-transporting ATPase subunit gamma